MLITRETSEIMLVKAAVFNGKSRFFDLTFNTLGKCVRKML